MSGVVDVGGDGGTARLPTMPPTFPLGPLPSDADDPRLALPLPLPLPLQLPLQLPFARGACPPPTTIGPDIPRSKEDQLPVRVIPDPPPPPLPPSPMLAALTGGRGTTPVMPSSATRVFIADAWAATLPAGTGTGTGDGERDLTDLPKWEFLRMPMAVGDGPQGGVGAHPSAPLRVGCSGVLRGDS